MKNKKLIAGMIALLAAGVIIWVAKIKDRRKRKIVAEAGYETAYDIYFPLKHNLPSARRAFIHETQRNKQHLN
jgi:hypothetical protein